MVRARGPEADHRAQVAAAALGVDLLSDDRLYANPDVMLSNSSGAYGLTISEHILMVTLMLPRMPNFRT